MERKQLKPKSSGEFLQQIFLDAQEQEAIDPMEKRAIASKNLKAGQTLALRRETVETSLDVLDKLLNDISKWRAIFDKENIDYTPMNHAFDSANEVIYTYLKAFNKRLRKPIKGQGQVAQLSHYLYVFRTFATERDDFMNSNYQPFIFLRQWASILTDASLFIAVQARSRDGFAEKYNSYFPRAERVSVVDAQAKAEKKMRWVEAQSEKVSIEKAKIEGE